MQPNGATHRVNYWVRVFAIASPNGDRLDQRRDNGAVAVFRRLERRQRHALTQDQTGQTLFVRIKPVGQLAPWTEPAQLHSTVKGLYAQHGRLVYTTRSKAALDKPKSA